MQNDLVELIQWFKANKLSLNVSKTNVVLFSNIHIPDYGNLYLNIENELIKLSDTAKFLGMFLDYRLNWNVQTSYIKKKMSCALYILNSTKHVVDTFHLKTLYYTLCHPYLTYGIILWGSAARKYLRPIEILQNKAVRIITNSTYNCHASQLKKSLDVLKLHDNLKVEVSKFMYFFHFNNK